MGARHVPALDGVRGVAVLLVVGYHARLLAGGWAGVSVFFALSGYLITGLLLSEIDRTGALNLPRFYRRRAARLGPALLVALLGMCLLWSTVGFGATAAINALVVLLYLGNVAHAFWATQTVQTGWSWSLALEEQFYAVWPLLLRRLLRRFSRHRIAAGLVGVAALLMLARLVVPNAKVSYNLVRGDDLLLGAALVLGGWALPRWTGLVGIGGLAWLLLNLGPDGPYSATLATCCAVPLLSLALTSHRAAWVFSLRPLRFFGRISYALYLWDGILSVWWDLEGDRSPVTPILIGLVSVALATASTFLLEQPVQRMTRRGERLVTRPGLAAA